MDEKIYLIGNKTDNAIHVANNPLFHIILLASLFVVSASFSPFFNGYSTLHIFSVAGILSMPSGVYYTVRHVRCYLGN